VHITAKQGSLNNKSQALKCRNGLKSTISSAVAIR